MRPHPHRAATTRSTARTRTVPNRVPHKDPSTIKARTNTRGRHRTNTRARHPTNTRARHPTNATGRHHRHPAGTVGTTGRPSADRRRAGTDRRLPAAGTARHPQGAGIGSGTDLTASLTRPASTTSRSTTSDTRRSRSFSPIRAVGASGSSVSGFRCKPIDERGRVANRGGPPFRRRIRPPGERPRRASVRRPRAPQSRPGRRAEPRGTPRVAADPATRHRGP
jgi:hypothetical protein